MQGKKPGFIEQTRRHLQQPGISLLLNHGEYLVRRNPVRALRNHRVSRAQVYSPIAAEPTAGIGRSTINNEHEGRTWLIFQRLTDQFGPPKADPFVIRVDYGSILYVE